MKDCLIVFAKEPQAGKVKTRLQGKLSQEDCAQLYKAFLQDTLELARAVPCEEKMLAYESLIEPKFLKAIAKDEFVFYKQRGTDLGQRLDNAFKFAKGRHNDKILIIGSDTPNLPVDYIKEAYVRLDKNDLVLGPSEDGGFYLIGFTQPCADLFSGVQWSADKVFEKTVSNAKNSGKKVAALKEWYDIDDAAGLAKLKRDLKKNKNSAPWTRKSLKI